MLTNKDNMTHNMQTKDQWWRLWLRGPGSVCVDESCHSLKDCAWIEHSYEAYTHTQAQKETQLESKLGGNQDTE